MSELLPKSYPYRAKITTMLMCILFFALCAAVLGFKAVTNDRGLILNGIFTLSEQGASVFFWILTATSLAFVVMGLLLIIQRATGVLSLELTECELKIPRGFIKKTLTHVNLSEVTKISEMEVQGQKFLYLHTAAKKFCVNRSLMPSKKCYDEIKELIENIVAIRDERNI